MMPNKAPNGNGTAPHKPSIAPHLRVKLSSPEDPKPNTHGHMPAANFEGSQNGAAHHLEDQEQLYTQATPQHTALPVQQHDVDAQWHHEAAEVLRSGSLQHLQNGDTALQHLEHATETAADFTGNGASSAPTVPDKSAAVSYRSGDPASMRSLQGRHVQGIVFDTETTGKPPVTTSSCFSMNERD